MNDDAILRELRDAAKRADEAKTGTALDAPLGDAFVAAAAARIAEEQRRAKAATNAAPSATRKPSRGRSIVRSPRTWAALALAAAIALVIARPWSGPSGAPLPAYAVAIGGGIDETRGEPRPRTEVTAQGYGRLVIALRPAHDVGGPVEVAVFGERGGVAKRSAARARVAPSGAIEIDAKARELVGDAAGPARVVVAIARAGSDLPSEAEAATQAAKPGVTYATLDLNVVP